jgi:hypothetical protein
MSAPRRLLRQWDTAFRALVQNDDGKPLAALLRSGRRIPPNAARALADLFDPRFPRSPFNFRPPSPDQRKMFADSKLKVEAAVEAARAEFARLAEIYNKQKRPDDRLELWDLELEAFAEQREDREALRAFAAHRKALDGHNAAKDALSPAVWVRLRVERSKEDWLRRLRDGRIAGEMFIRIIKGQRVTEAAEAIGAKLDRPLKERQTTKIWSEMRKANPALIYTSMNSLTEAEFEAVLEQFPGVGPDALEREARRIIRERTPPERKRQRRRT